MGFTKIFIAILFIKVMFLSTQGQARSLIQDKTMSMELRYRRWMAEQGRPPSLSDTTAEDERFEIFKENAEFVDKINGEDKPFKLALNKWPDITNEEFKSRLRYKPYNASAGSGLSHLMKAVHSDDAQEPPPTVDWREAGAVTRVREQGDCGACWAFSAVAVVESMTFINQGILFELSEQQLIDCDLKIDRGCRDGNPIHAYEFMIENNGTTIESDYPYKGEQGFCVNNEAFTIFATIYGYVLLPSNEKEIMKVVAKQPVAIGIRADCDAFRFYSSGILTEDCGGRMSHAVALVGYGEENGVKYWIGKNSWGTNWGENGYIRLKRESGIADGLCGLGQEPTYPTF